jgi:SpoVK/Ycf46/Vps4 family AAA+-type ATPase
MKQIKQSTEMNYCPFCGEQLTSVDPFCPYCGESLTSPKASATELFGVMSSQSAVTLQEGIDCMVQLMNFIQDLLNIEENQYYRDIHTMAKTLLALYRERSDVTPNSDAERDALARIYEFSLKILEVVSRDSRYQTEKQTFQGIIHTLQRINPALIEEERAASASPQIAVNEQEMRDSEILAEINEITQNLGGNAPSFRCHNYRENYSYRTELDKLIGMDSVKNMLEEQINNYIVQRKRKEKHPDLDTSITFHCLFTGNPGTGKTTVARIIGGLFRSKGLLKSGHCIEVSATDLVPGWVGMGARIARLAALKAMDGVLFIDEAYALGRRGSVSGNQGDEVMDELTKMMEDYRDRFIVVLAGYDKEMSEFMAQTNTGLRSRFNCTLHFPDYKADEMYQIFQKFVKKDMYKMESKAETNMQQTFHRIEKMIPRLSGFANARTVRQIFEAVKRKASIRMSKLDLHCNIDLITAPDTLLSDEEMKNLLGVNL